MNTKTAYQTLIYYCLTHGIEIETGKTWSFRPVDNTITQVWRGKATKSWIFSMLHELGHFRIRSSKEFATKSWKIHQTDIAVPLDRVLAMEMMREEIEAWEEGLVVAKSLGLEIDRKEYDRYSSKYIMRYMREIPKSYDYWKKQNRRTV